MSECQCPNREALEALIDEARDLEAMAHAAEQEIEALPYRPPEERDVHRCMGRLTSLVPAVASQAERLLDEMEQILRNDAVPTPLDS